MTVVESAAPAAYETVAVDLYRDIHKGIRADLFALTGATGSIDPGDPADVRAVAAHLEDTIKLLMTHAGHEDAHVQPALVEHLPDLAEAIEAQHEELERRLLELRDWAADAVAAPSGTRREPVQRLYVELASFTSAYLAHQDLEERAVGPRLERTIGREGAGAIHQAIIASIPPEEMAVSLALMLPAMNNDDRTELLGGMQAGAPPEVFEGVWSLAGSVLTPGDVAVVGRRLGR